MLSRLLLLSHITYNIKMAQEFRGQRRDYLLWRNERIWIEEKNGARRSGPGGEKDSISFMFRKISRVVQRVCPFFWDLLEYLRTESHKIVFITKEISWQVNAKLWWGEETEYHKIKFKKVKLLLCLISFILGRIRR